VKGLFPEPGIKQGGNAKDMPIGVFDMLIENDELLTEHRILYNQTRMTFE